MYTLHTPARINTDNPIQNSEYTAEKHTSPELPAGRDTGGTRAVQISPHGSAQGGPLPERTPRSRPLEFEARDLLATGGYFVMHRNGAKTPVNLMGVSDNEVLMVQVRRSRTPLSGVRDVHERYRSDMDLIRKVGGTRFCKKELWVYSRPDGWHYYEVFPGGFMELDEP